MAALARGILLPPILPVVFGLQVRVWCVHNCADFQDQVASSCLQWDMGPSTCTCTCERVEHASTIHPRADPHHRFTLGGHILDRPAVRERAVTILCRPGRWLLASINFQPHHAIGRTLL